MGHPVGTDRFQDCCEMKSIRFWGWNVCTLAKDDLNGMLDTLNEAYVWDAIAIHEDLKSNQQGTFRIKNSWAVIGPSRGRGARMLLLAPRLGSLLRRTCLDECSVVQKWDSPPFVRVFLISSGPCPWSDCVSVCCGPFSCYPRADLPRPQSDLPAGCGGS